MKYQVKKDQVKKNGGKYGSLPIFWAQEMGGEKLMAMQTWGNSEDASSMWDRIANCIRKVAREVLGVSRCITSGHEGIGSGVERSKGK